MPRPLRRKQTGKKSTAQAMVEFSLALPILLLVMYGLIETGRLVFMYASVVSAARQAVRYGSATGDNASGIPYYNDCAGIRSSAKALGFLQAFSDSDIQIKYDNGPNAPTPWSQATCPITDTDHPVNGDRIYVKASTQFAPIVPLVPFRPFTISSSGWRTLLVGVAVAMDPASIIIPPGVGSVSFVKDAWCASCTPPGSYYEWAGQTIRYTYTIFNNGSNPVTTDSVTDNLPATVMDCSEAMAANPLPPGGTTHCYGNYTVSPNDVTGASISNIGTYSGTDTVTLLPVLAQSSKTINFVPKPKLALDKTSDMPDIVGVGTIITYTYTLTNMGNVRLYAPYAINDNGALDAPPVCTGTGYIEAATWAAGVITPGGTTTCTAYHTIIKNDVDRKYVDNTATATARTSAGFVVTSNSDTEHVLVPGLLMELTASTPTKCADNINYCVTGLGQTITYTYKITNRTANKIYTVSVRDSNGAVLTGCGWYSLSSLQSVTCTGTYSAYSQARLDSGIISDQAYAIGYRISSNVATVSVGVTLNLSLQLTKTPSTTTAYTLNAPITYTYKLTNLGNVTLRSPYTVVDNKITPVSCSGATSTIAPNGGYTNCTASITVKQADIDNGSIVNTATATATYVSGTGSQTVTSSQVSATVITYQLPRMSLIKTATPSVFSAAGQTITYTFTLKNTGGTTLTPPYTISDAMFPGLQCTASTNIDPSKSATCTQVTYTTTLVDVAQGTITNSASATAQSVYNGTPTTVPASTVSPTIVGLFLCDRSHLLYGPTLIPSGTDVTWTITNNTGMTIHISSITVAWTGPVPPTVPILNQVWLNGTQIWNGTNAFGGGFVVPGGPWLLNGAPAPDNPIRLVFLSQATGIRIVVTFTEPSCPILDSSKAPG